ncbi:MAG: hypothetical protein AB8G22_27210 [Saprospiraceae bacterium]
MSLNKKKSRLIIIDNEKFRWVVSPSSGYLVYVAEKEEVKGRKIEVFIDSDINDYWVEFPNVSNLNLKIVKPKDSESIIRQALKLNWNPEEKGKPIVFDLIDDKLKKRVNT